VADSRKGMSRRRENGLRLEGLSCVYKATRSIPILIILEVGRTYGSDNLQYSHGPWL
jgi:hypothetical protein